MSHSLMDPYAASAAAFHTSSPSAPTQFDYDRLALYLQKSPSHRIYSKHQNHFFWSESTGVVTARQFSEFDFSFGDVTTVLKRGPFWFNFHDPSPREMDDISQAFGLHPLTTEDIQTPDTREKCEVFPQYYFVVLRSFEQDSFKGTYLQPIPFFIFTATNHPRNVVARIDQLTGYGLHVTTDWINYALIDDIVDGFVPVLKSCEFEVDSIDDLVLILKEADQFDMLRRIGRSRKQVNLLLRNMSTKADVIKSVIHRCMDQLAPDSETRLYLEVHLLIRIYTTM